MIVRYEDLAGKVALVTGAAGILGRRYVEAFLGQGCRVAALDLDVQSLQDIGSDQDSDRLLRVATDITSEESVASAVELVVATFGSIDILLNNAASKSKSPDRFFDPHESYSLRTWREVMAVNVDGMFLVGQAVGRHMKAQPGGGSIIQVCSIYGVVAPDQRIYEGSEYLGRPINTPAVYSASKAAVVGLTQYLSTYWAANGIRVNTLTPGGVESGQNAVFKTKYGEKVPLGRMAEASEMVQAVLFLASSASSYITGHNLIVDGGFTVW